MCRNRCISIVYLHYGISIFVKLYLKLSLIISNIKIYTVFLFFYLNGFQSCVKLKTIILLVVNTKHNHYEAKVLYNCMVCFSSIFKDKLKFKNF